MAALKGISKKKQKFWMTSAFIFAGFWASTVASVATAANLPLCSLQANSHITEYAKDAIFKKNVNLVAYIQGPEAMYRLDSMKGFLEEDTMSPGDNAVLIRSENQICGQYELTDLGCQVNWCALIEKK